MSHRKRLPISGFAQNTLDPTFDDYGIRNLRVECRHPVATAFGSVPASMSAVIFKDFVLDACQSQR